MHCYLLTLLYDAPQQANANAFDEGKLMCNLFRYHLLSHDLLSLSLSGKPQPRGQPTSRREDLLVVSATVGLAAIAVIVVVVVTTRSSNGLFVSLLPVVGETKSGVSEKTQKRHGSRKSRKLLCRIISSMWSSGRQPALQFTPPFGLEPLWAQIEKRRRDRREAVLAYKSGSSNTSSTLIFLPVKVGG